MYADNLAYQIMPELKINGVCGYAINADRIALEIAEISSYRDFSDLSGTLSVEVWALIQPYAGGQFWGEPLAGTTIGEVQGQHLLQNCHYDLCFNQPTEGTWYLTLMLREWTGEGFVTRDFINFPTPYVVQQQIYQDANPQFNEQEHPVSNVIAVDFQSDKSLEEARPEIAVEPVIEPVEVKVAAEAPAEPKVKTSKAKKLQSARRVAINSCGKDEIQALKGVSKKLASEIYANRPYATLDELLDVKGVGKKLLDKIRDLITL